MIRSGILSLLGFVTLMSSAAANKSTPTLEQEIDDFFHDPEIFDFRISTDGSCLSYGEYRGKSQRSLMTVDFSKKEQRGLEAAPGEDIVSQGWVGPDRFVYEKGTLGMTRPVGIFSSKVLFHSPLRLNDELQQFSSVMRWPRVVHPMPHDPEICAVIDRREQGQFRDVLYLNVVTGEYAGRVKNPGKADRIFLDAKGQGRIALVRGSEKGKIVWLYRDDNDDEWRALPLGEEVADWRFFDGGKVAYAEVVDGPRVFVQAYDFVQQSFVGSPIQSETADVTVDGFIHDPSTMAIFGMQIDEGRPRTIWFDKGVAELASQLSQAFPDSLITFLGANWVSKDLFFRVASDINPGAYYAITSGGKLSLLGEVNSRLKDYELPRSELVQFANREGQMIEGYLTLPSPGTKRAPLLVMPHGGPHARDRWTYDAERQFFAHKGFATLTVNYRGSSGYGKAFWEQDGFASILERSVNDVIDATRWAASHDAIDPERIGIMGGSFGGYIAVEAVAREPELYRCSVGFAGVYDWKRQLAASRRDGRSSWDWYIAPKWNVDEEQDRIASMSPINYPDRINVPVLLIHGKADARVEDVQSRSLSKSLKRLGKDCELILDTWGRHGFIDEDRRVDFYRQVYAFMDEHVRSN